MDENESEESKNDALLGFGFALGVLDVIVLVIMWCLAPRSGPTFWPGLCVTGGFVMFWGLFVLRNAARHLEELCWLTLFWIPVIGFVMIIVYGHVSEIGNVEPNAYIFGGLTGISTSLAFTLFLTWVVGTRKPK